MSLDKIEKQLEESNRAKYGNKDLDQISLCYSESKEKGDVWCSENIKRYLGRFTRKGSTKANNLTDLIKCKDYLQRMIDFNSSHPELNNSEEIEENFKNE